MELNPLISYYGIMAGANIAFAGSTNFSSGVSEALELSEYYKDKFKETYDTISAEYNRMGENTDTPIPENIKLQIQEAQDKFESGFNTLKNDLENNKPIIEGLKPIFVISGIYCVLLILYSGLSSFFTILLYDDRFLLTTSISILSGIAMITVRFIGNWDRFELSSDYILYLISIIINCSLLLDFFDFSLSSMESWGIFILNIILFTFSILTLSDWYFTLRKDLNEYKKYIKITKNKIKYAIAIYSLPISFSFFAFYLFSCLYIFVSSKSIENLFIFLSILISLCPYFFHIISMKIKSLAYMFKFEVYLSNEIVKSRGIKNTYNNIMSQPIVTFSLITNTLNNPENHIKENNNSYFYKSANYCLNRFFKRIHKIAN